MQLVRWNRADPAQRIATPGRPWLMLGFNLLVPAGGVVVPHDQAPPPGELSTPTVDTPAPAPLVEDPAPSPLPPGDTLPAMPRDQELELEAPKRKRRKRGGR